MNKVNQDEINGILWKACDTFRGVVDPSEYKNYILVMLFVKYLSDIWQDKVDEFTKEFKGDKDRIQRRLSRERFVLPKGCDFKSLYDQRNEPNIGEIINNALEEIEEKNKEKLEGVFRNIDFNSEANLGKTKDRNARLKHLLQDFNDERLDLRPSRIGNLDIIGNAYEYLIARFAAGAGKKGGEFYTPPEVAELLAKLVEPKPGDKICDPTCGSGSLLIKTAKEVGSKDFAVFGQESNGSTWALGLMNMFLHGLDSARIEWADTLRNPQLLDGDKLMQFNVVVANPPFSLDKWGADEAESDKHKRFWRGIPPKSKGDYAFITHMIETANAVDGRVAVIAPHGVLFRGGSEGKIREALVEENLLDTVIGLPENLFYGTGIPACILVLRKNRKHKDILFINASRDFEQGKNQNRLRSVDLERIIQAIKNRIKVDRYAHVASIHEIKENEFNLNIPRYVDTFEAEPSVEIRKVQMQIQILDQQLLDAEREIARHLKELGVS